MATLTLNDGISTMQPDSKLAELYGKLYQMMHDANQVELPDYSQDPPLDAEGNIDQNAIRIKILADSEIMIKNAAYGWANAIVTTTGGGSGDTPGEGFISRSGDSMEGALGALYGFQGGHNGQMILELTHDGSLESDSFKGRVAHVDGHLRVDGNSTVKGQLNLGDAGIFFSQHQSIFYADNKLHIDSQDIIMSGALEIDGSFKLGDVTINSKGLFNGSKEYYHSGNSNNNSTDWSMRDAHVYGDLIVEGGQEIYGRLVAMQGFDLGENEQMLLYSIDPDNPQDHTPSTEKNTCYLQLESDLNLWSGYSIKFSSRSIIKAQSGQPGIVSLCAPGMVMNLGDSDSGTPTIAINLQSDIKHFNGDYAIVSKEGAGQFRNGFAAWTALAGTEVMSTYSGSDIDDKGVLFKRRIRLGSTNGVAIYSPKTNILEADLPYLYTDSSALLHLETIPFSLKFAKTDSQFAALNNDWSASLVFDIGTTAQGSKAEMFVFSKPVEASRFSIVSSKYKTSLIENALFLGDGVFIEGVYGDKGADGMRFSGNAYILGNIGTARFSGGMSGYGWGIINNNKSYGATFDELTVRKKFRVYELEVQKQSATNGSLWITDSCSGDSVEAID